MGLSYKRVPWVRRERCNACRLCDTLCPHGCLAVRGETGVLVQAGACTSEGLCVSNCPERAIKMVWARVKGDTSVGLWRTAGALADRRTAVVSKR